MKDEIRLPDQQECREKFSRTFRNLSQDELNLLFSDEFVQFYKKGSIVYSEGARMKGCYFVYNGIIKIFQTGYEGKEQIIKFEKEGDFSASAQSSSKRKHVLPLKFFQTQFFILFQKIHFYNSSKPIPILHTNSCKSLVKNSENPTVISKTLPKNPSKNGWQKYYS